MILYGKNPLTEFIATCPEMIEEIFILQGINRKEINRITSGTESNNIKISYISKARMEQLCGTSKHQGVAARINDFEYTHLDRLFEASRDKKSCSTVVVLDHLEDPQNFGAILRTAGYFDIDGIIIPKDRAVPVTPSVIKVSAGAASTVPVSMVTNLSNTIRKLKDKGYWIVGTDAGEGTDIQKLDINDLDIVVVVGNESGGMSRKLKELCDFVVKIKGYGKVESLNVSVATGIILYEVTRSLRAN